ncbi:helix-turn-helix domain-containing protein [Chloroflexota bacterium]
MNDKVVFTIPEVAKMLGISRNFGYEMARRGELPVISLGRRRFVPRASFAEWLRKGNGYERTH